MAFRCEICNKGPMAGKSISHSHKASNRRFLPNLQRIRAVVHGRVMRIKACSRCIRSNRVRKAGSRPRAAA